MHYHNITISLTSNPSQTPLTKCSSVIDLRKPYEESYASDSMP